MAGTAVEIDPQLIAFTLPSIPESARIARFHIRAALGFHDLGHLADDAAIINSELVTNAVQHAGCDVTETIRVTLARTRDQDSVIIVVSDSSPHGPVMRNPTADSEPGRGLQIVASLSVHWGWHPEPHGKTVYAILATETDARRRDGTAASIRSPRRKPHRRREHPHPARAQRMDPSGTWPADGVAQRLDRMRRRRPPQRTTARIHHRGSPAAGRHLRRHPLAAHSTVRELQRPATERVLMPGMRSHADGSALIEIVTADRNAHRSSRS